MNTIFVHIPKTAGQSIEHIFLQKIGLSWRERSQLLLRPNGDPSRGPERLAHLLAREYYECNYMTEQDFARHFKFSVVRNPYARAVSQYKFRYQSRGLSFPAFVRNIEESFGSAANTPRHLAPQHDFLFHEDGTLLVDAIARFERLDEELAPIFSKIFEEPIALPVVNRSSDRTPVQEFYDNDTKRTIARLYERDFDSFKYAF